MESSSSNPCCIGYTSMIWTVIGVIILVLNATAIMMGIKYNSIGTGTLMHAFSAGVMLMTIL